MIPARNRTGITKEEAPNLKYELSEEEIKIIEET